MMLFASTSAVFTISSDGKCSLFGLIGRHVDGGLFFVLVLPPVLKICS